MYVIFPRKQQKMADSSSSSTWYQVCVKVRFFSRIQRLLARKTSSSKRFEPSSGQSGDGRTQEIIVDQGENRFVAGSESSNHGDDDDNGILQRSVKRLHFGSQEEKAAAAREIKRLAGDDLRRRKLMADLGVIPPLVAMVGSEYTAAHRRLAVQALLELANGTFTNKALMVEAGILPKLSENIIEESTKHEFAQLIMSLSSLVNAQFPIDSSRILPLVLHMLESNSSVETKMLCLGTLYNLSTMIDNVGSLATNEVVHTLLKLSSTKEASEKSLATLGNLVVTSVGKKALENNPMVPECLIEILAWDDKSKSQELSAYILMILAHQSSLQRTKMAEGGIVPILLQVALLGTPLAQKRSLKLLQWFKDERQMKMGPHSGPQTRRPSFSSPVNHRDAGEGKKLMKKMVQQSLHKNMETITRRANGDLDSNAKLKLLAISSSSKSLPY